MIRRTCEACGATFDDCNNLVGPALLMGAPCVHPEHKGPLVVMGKRSLFYVSSNSTRMLFFGRFRVLLVFLVLCTRNLSDFFFVDDDVVLCLFCRFIRSLFFLSAAPAPAPGEHLPPLMLKNALLASLLNLSGSFLLKETLF